MLNLIAMLFISSCIYAFIFQNMLTCWKAWPGGVTLQISYIPFVSIKYRLKYVIKRISLNKIEILITPPLYTNYFYIFSFHSSLETAVKHFNDYKTLDWQPIGVFLKFSTLEDATVPHCTLLYLEDIFWICPGRWSHSNILLSGGFFWYYVL